VDAADIDLTSDRIWDLHEVQDGYEGSEEAVKKLLEPPPPIVDEEDGIIFNGIQSEHVYMSNLVFNGWGLISVQRL
jgi:hypothetical protein